MKNADIATRPPSPAAPRKKPGRPLSFDREYALEQAMLVFWQYGYETTSLNDLTAAMGITPPSLYGAFGDKETLFLEAVQRYTFDAAQKNGKSSEAQANVIFNWTISPPLQVTIASGMTASK